MTFHFEPILHHRFTCFVVATACACCLLVLHHDAKIAIKRELGLLWNSLLDYTYQSSSISKATPTFKDTPISACSTGMKAIPAISDHASKGHLSGKLRPLSLPKPTIILPFSHSKTMTVLKDGHMKPVTFLCALPTCMHALMQGPFSTLCYYRHLITTVVLVNHLCQMCCTFLFVLMI